MSFSGYQIRGDVLNTMKQAAGDYMPEYGNWRYQLNHPEPEPEIPPDTPPGTPPGKPPVKPPVDGPDPFSGEGVNTIDAVDPVTKDVVIEGEKVRYRDIFDPSSKHYRDDIVNSWNKKGGYDAYVADREGYLDPSHPLHKQHMQNLKKQNSSRTETQIVTDGIEGSSENWNVAGYRNANGDLVINSLEGEIPDSFWSQHDIDPNDSAIAEAIGGNFNTGSEDGGGSTLNYKDRSPMNKRSPFAYKNRDLYKGVDKFLEAQSHKAEVNGAYATKALHGHIKKFAGDVKTNLYFKDTQGDKTQEKVNQAAASSAVVGVGKSTTEAYGPEGTMSTFHKNYLDNIVSESITPQEEYVMGHLLQPGPEVIPRVDENNHVTYMVPMPTGDHFPATTQWMAETTAKRTKPYATAQAFTDSRAQFFDAGRAGQPWDKDAIIMRNLRMVDSNPDQLAALLLDGGLFHPRPLIDLILEGEDNDDSSPYTSSMNVDSKQLVLQAVGDKADRKQLEQKFAEGLERIAFNTSYTRGLDIYNKENKKDNPTAGMSLEEKKKFYQGDTNIA